MRGVDGDLIIVCAAFVFVALESAAVYGVIHFWVWYTENKIERRSPRRCRACGYDLRASPERCPECGSLVTWEAVVG
jgi:hypothetical protein